MIVDNSKVILYIEPSKPKATSPVLDDLTIKMFNAFLNKKAYGVLDVGRKNAVSFEEDVYSMGHHTCICETDSTGYDYQLSTDQITNFLCVHYLAYHRDEVPEKELKKVAALPDSSELDEKDKEKLMKML